MTEDATYQPINKSTHQHLLPYLLHLADNTLILAQRNSEWTGHGPVLEQDIAITNIALDYLGQARNLYALAAAQFNEASAEQLKNWENLIPTPWKEYGRAMEEDDLAFLRNERQYLNLLITELPKGDWAFSILRQFFFSTFQYLQFSELKTSPNEQLAAIAEKSLKEVTYHQRWSGEWVIRLGDGTEESRQRIESALAELWPFTGEMFRDAGYETGQTENGKGILPSKLQSAWNQKISEVFAEANLTVPPTGWMQEGGKQGRHTEYLGYLLAEMQYLQRTYPNQTW